MEKPLGRKAYGSIPHLPGSRRGKGDHGVNDGQAAIAFGKVRDKFDRIYIQEKLDGSNVAVALLDDGRIVALGRSGYLAESSPYLQHQIFSDWVYDNEERFRSILKTGEWISGEWIAQAHGTLYELKHEPFVAFDIFSKGDRLLFEEFSARILLGNFGSPYLLPFKAAGDCGVDLVIPCLDIIADLRGALDPIEGAVWRVERNNKVDFLCKYVRPGKVDGKYLPGCGNNGEVTDPALKRRGLPEAKANSGK